MRGKTHVQKCGGRAKKIKKHYLAVALVLIGAGLMPQIPVRADKCPSLRVVFARGSGGERWNDPNYLAFKTSIEGKLTTVSLDYEFIDLDYPAVGIDKLDVMIGAAVGSGDAYEFGESIDKGVRKLTAMVNGTSCPGTKYVLGGYSQGAMVISKALRGLKAERIIYAATFGDPKIYLPEGAGVIPAACKGENLSDYRMHVPDCRAYKGLLGSYIPYEPTDFTGKVGTWCNRRDIFCSSYLNISDHTSYVTENLYEDASRVIFDKITKTYELENHVSSPHDTAILIDSTGSMASMIDSYKAEALRLATETLNAGGRVALFDYRDLNDPYNLVQHCDFESCTLEVFEQELTKITTNGGGDKPESLLSASFHTMQALNWKQGSTKSLVILTDANFLAPDRDGMTFDEVVALSKRIDPVNFYIVTNAEHGEDYADLAARTDGRVVTDFDELSLLTDYIMERYDSLPRVEENNSLTEMPMLELMNTEWLSDTEVTLRFTNTGTKTMVILNDAVLGITNSDEVTISGLDVSVANTVFLVPLNEEIKGEGVEIKLGSDNKNSNNISGGAKIEANTQINIVKAPNSGKR